MLGACRFHINLLLLFSDSHSSHINELWLNMKNKLWSRIFAMINKRRYLVSNDTMSAVSKFNKYEIYQQKITSSLTNERHMLVGSLFLYTCPSFIEF